MRFLAVIAIVAPIIVVGWVVGRRPRPASPAQVEARAVADSLTRGRLDAFERGDVAAWAAPLRSDGLVIAADPADVLIGPAAAAAGMRQDSAGAAVRLAIEPGAAATGATRRGRMAWAAVPLGTRVQAGGDSLRATAVHSVVWLKDDDAWQVLAGHDARALDWDALRAGAAAGRFPAPVALEAPRGRGAQRLARAFQRRLPALAGRRVDRQAIGVSPTGAIAVGDSAVRAMLADCMERLGEPRLAPGGITARAPRDRGVGWVAANLEATPPGWGGVTLPLRYMCVYRVTGEDNWTLVLAHLSVGVPDEQGPIAGASR